MDVQMDEVDEGMRDFNMQVLEVEECVGAAERTYDVFEAFVDGHTPHVATLERQVRDLQEMVGRLMVWRAVLQHGSGNLLEVFDDDEELEDPVVMVGPEGWLVPIQEIPIEGADEDEEVLAEEEVEQIVLAGGVALEYEEEEVPTYEEAPKYQIPPIIE